MENQASNIRLVAGIYDDLAPVWDRRQGLVERVLMGEGMRRALAAELRGDVLEIGTGTGATLPFLADSADLTSFTAVDLSAGMLGEAREAAERTGRSIRLAQMNAEALAFPDAPFDTVTTSLMLCTVPDPTRALSEMARVCKPNGRIVVLEHVRSPNRFFARLQQWMTPGQVRRLGCHLDRPTDRLVREMGFRIEQDTSRFFGVFHLIVMRPPAGSGNDAIG
ncbi:MAG: class I SAM-dependent methyltransferase [Thermomicrobiales bacterium]